MKKYHYIILLTILVLTTLYGCGVANKTKTTAAKQEYTTIEYDKIGRTIHHVQKGESLYKIALLYNTTQEKLIELNPISRNKKIKKGMNIIIPSKSKVKDEIKKEEEPIIKEEKPIEEDKKETKAIKAALILPFMLNSYAPTEQSRMVEFYEGFLMAVDTLKKQGFSFDIYAFDSGSADNNLDTLINNGHLNEMDIIFGALHTNHTEKLAQYAKSHKTPLVVPFSSRDIDKVTNPYIYLTNASQAQLYGDIFSHFAKEFPLAHIIFVKDSVNVDKADYIQHLKSNLIKRGNSFTEIEQSILLQQGAFDIPQLLDVMKQDTLNLFIPTSGHITALTGILPALTLLKRDTINLVPDFKLFGFPEWQIYARENRGAMYEVDTYFYAPFYTNNLMPETTEFNRHFIRNFNKSMQNTYPQYGLLGYDIGYYFLLATGIHKKDIEKNINHIEFEPLQWGFKFIKDKNGGNINSNVYFINFTPQYEILKINFDK